MTKEGQQSPKVFLRDATGLTRELSATDALVGNLAVMGIGFVFLYAFFASLLYPGVNLPLTVVIGLLPGIVIALVYYFFSVAMPRTGGDFVWVSRVLHPSLGFITNFYFTFTILTLTGSAAVFVASFGISPMLSALGLIYSNQNLITLAGKVASAPWDFVIAGVVLLVCIIPQFFRAKVTYRTLIVIFAIVVIGSLVTIVSFYSASPSVFSANFNRLSGMNYTNVITTAALPSGFSVGVLFTGIVYTMLSYAGYNYSGYYSGEVRQVKRSQLIAMFGSLFIFALFMFLLYESAYYSMGSNFLSSLSYLAGTGSSSYTLPSAPVLNFLVMFSNPSPVVVFLSALAFIGTCAAAIITATFISVRNFFAWSFDRVMPGWLTNVSSKRNSPFIAVSVALVCTVIFAALYVYTNFFSFITYSVATIYIAFGITSIAAIAFPFVKKSIFESSPVDVKRKIGGFPLISILGILGLIVCSFLIYASILPAVTPPPSGPALIGLLAYVVVPLTGVVALAIYAVAYYYRKSKGINLAMVFSEIPPE